MEWHGFLLNNHVIFVILSLEMRMEEEGIAENIFI